MSKQLSPEEALAFLNKSIVKNPGINLQNGEICYYASEATATIIKNQVVGATYNSMGGGMYKYGIGIHARQSIRNNQFGQVVNTYAGHLYLTTKRFLLIAYKGGFDIRLDKITALEFYSDGLMVSANAKSYLVGLYNPSRLKEIITANNIVQAAFNSNSSNKRICSNCGQPVEEGNNFCANCGERLYKTATRGNSWANVNTKDENVKQDDNGIHNEFAYVYDSYQNKSTDDIPNNSAMRWSHPSYGSSGRIMEEIERIRRERDNSFNKQNNPGCLTSFISLFIILAIISTAVNSCGGESSNNTNEKPSKKSENNPDSQITQQVAQEKVDTRIITNEEPAVYTIEETIDFGDISITLHSLKLKEDTYGYWVNLDYTLNNNTSHEIKWTFRKYGANWIFGEFRFNDLEDYFWTENNIVDHINIVSGGGDRYEEWYNTKTEKFEGTLEGNSSFSGFASFSITDFYLAKRDELYRDEYMEFDFYLFFNDENHLMHIILNDSSADSN